MRKVDIAEYTIICY